MKWHACAGEGVGFVQNHSLSIVTLGAFLVIWMGAQAWSGHRAYNDDQRAHGEPTVSFGEYLTRADFGEATFETGSSSSADWRVRVVDGVAGPAGPHPTR